MLAALFLFVAPAQAQLSNDIPSNADWRFLKLNPGGSTTYYDALSLQRTGDIALIWETTVPHPGEIQGVLSGAEYDTAENRMQWRIDCRRSVQQLSAWYTIKTKKERVGFEEFEPSDTWLPIGEHGLDIFLAACDPRAKDR